MLNQIISESYQNDSKKNHSNHSNHSRYKISEPHTNLGHHMISAEINLTGDPEITFNKCVFKRFTQYETKYCVVNKCNLENDKKNYHYELNLFDKCHLLYKIYLIRTDDINLANIKNVKISHGNTLFINLSGVSLENIYMYSNLIQKAKRYVK